MKNIIIIISIIVLLIGCGNDPQIPPEGETEYKRTFMLMNGSENALYKSIVKYWFTTWDDFVYDSELLSLRTAVRTRTRRPFEDSIPFYEFENLLNILKQNNLTLSTNTSVVGKQKNVIASIQNILNTIENEKIRPKKRQELIQIDTKEPLPSTKVKTVIIPEEEILPLEYYNKLKEDVKGCDTAKFILKDKLTSGKQLTYSDKNEIMKEVIYCKSKNL